MNELEKQIVAELLRKISANPDSNFYILHFKLFMEAVDIRVRIEKKTP